MTQLLGKVIEASALKSDPRNEEVGPALKKLRQMSQLTQREMASRLSVQQSAISKIEKGGDVHISTIRKYVEALGATLRMGASFPAEAPLALHICDAFDIECGNDDQFVLPILGDDAFRPQRDVVLSIRPHYSERILDGHKTVELRRRFPVSAPQGTIAYIYSTSPVRAIVGMAQIDDVLKLPIDKIWADFETKAFIERADFDKYFDGLGMGFALLFKNVRSFENPIPLEELRERFNFEPPQSFLYAKQNLRKALENEYSVVSD